MSDEYGVIFDMDGVIVDSYRPHFRSWRLLARENGLELTEADFARLFGRTSREILRELWPGGLDEVRVRQLDDRKEHLYRQIIRDEIPACEGLFDLLDDLAGGGVCMAVGSSGPPENVDLVLDGLNIRRFFSGVVTGRDVERGKPDPQVFLTAAAKINVHPGRCVVVEDAPAGLLAAHRAGMKAVAVTGSHPAERLVEADIIVDSLGQLDVGVLGHLIESE
ncbi:MAG: HAD family phosphatase [Phycisphaerae bacterium]|nr:HAD family phosphatase [Phycisphaerae bacterium]